jgi:alkylation response protein AidB-like acyl-CoA dehydrogenase
VDLRYSEADEAFRKEVRAFLDGAVASYGPPPAAGDWAARRAYDTGWQRLLYDGGYAGLNWPVEYGGRRLPASQQLVFLEECAAAGAPYVGITFVGLAHAGPTLIAAGTDEQRHFHLPRILRGESVWCQGFSEPGAGSDLASLRTRAERDGDHYVVTGQKIWTTRAHVADYCELLVRTDPDAPRHKGISWLIMDMRSPGVEVRQMKAIDGESHFCEVFLDDVRIPVANRVGDENDGWRVTNVTLRFERGTAFAQRIITLRSQLRRLVGLAREQGAWDDPGLQRHMGRLDARIDGLWRMTQRCVTEVEATGVPSPLGSAVKLGYSELGQEIARVGMRLLGRRALGHRAETAAAGRADGGPDTDEARIVHDYLWSFQNTIAAGTSQIQRNVIAERILGMPKGGPPR